MYLAYGATDGAMDVPHSGYTPNVTPGGKLPAPPLHTLAPEIVRVCGHIGAWVKRKNAKQREDCAGSGTEQSYTITRTDASYVWISRMTVGQILHPNDMYPYHIQSVQLLHEEDFAPRLLFASWYLQMRARDLRFPDTFLFTDESTFTREGIIFTLYNTYVKSGENQHATKMYVPVS